MKTKIYILILIVLSSCNDKNDDKTFEDKIFTWVNIDKFLDCENSDYGLYEFLDNHRLISESKFDSLIILQQGFWDYLTQDNREFIVLEELTGHLDTFDLIENKKFNDFKFICNYGDTLHFKLITEKSNFEIKKLIDKKWISINDKSLDGFDTITGDLIFKYSEYIFNSDMTYSINDRKEKIGTWRVDASKNRIFLDSLTVDQDVIKIEKLTVDTLIIWRRDYSTKPNEIILIKKKN